MDDVQQRFSRQDSAEKWNDLYTRNSDVPEEVSFRQRCAFTVDTLVGALAPNARVLDLGCGTGPVVAELLQRGFDCVGLDYSPDMLDFARQRLRSKSLDDSKVLQGDCRHTTFADGGFDAVVCLGVISYVEHYESVLTEIRRVLKPGGLLIVSFRNKFNPIVSDPVELARTLAKRLIRGRDQTPYTIGQFLDFRLFVQKMDSLDYQYVTFRGIGFGPFRIAGRVLSSQRVAVRTSHLLESLLHRTGLTFLARWMSDVSVWIYRAPTTACPSNAEGH